MTQLADHYVGLSPSQRREFHKLVGHKAPIPTPPNNEWPIVVVLLMLTAAAFVAWAVG